MRYLLAAAFALACTGWSAGLPSGVPARPTEPVTDLVGRVSPGVQQQINTLLRQRWQAGRGQVGVLILPSLEDRPIEDVSLSVARGWGLGGAESDDGVLLLIAPTERQLRIEVGQKNEGWLTDAASKRIIEDRMAPSLRQGDFDGAVLAGVAGILEALEGKEPTPLQAPASQMPWGKVAVAAAFFLLWTLFQIPSAKAAARPMGLHRNPWFWGFLLAYSLFSLLIQALSRGGRGIGGLGGGGGGYGGGGGGYSGGGASGRW